MESDASTSPRRQSSSCYSDSGDSSCSERFSECGSDDLSFTPTAAAGIHRLLLSCAADASDDAISSLVAELESPSSSLDSLRRAAMELRLLAKHNPDNRIRISAAGAVRPLVALLSHADPLLQEHGVTALLNLSICDENKAIIVEAGVIRPLVHALKSAASPAARENAACALHCLSQLDGAAAADIGRAGAIPLLVSLLQTDGARGKKDAATTLYALCSGARENRLRAVEAVTVRPLLDLMADPESGMVDKAASVLHSLVGASEGRSAAVEEGGVPILVEMVEVGTPRQKEITTLSLLQICEDNAVYRTMVAREGTTRLCGGGTEERGRRRRRSEEVGGGGGGGGGAGWGGVGEGGAADEGGKEARAGMEGRRRHGEPRGCGGGDGEERERMWGRRGIRAGWAAYAEAWFNDVHDPNDFSLRIFNE